MHRAQARPGLRAQVRGTHPNRGKMTAAAAAPEGIPTSAVVATSCATALGTEPAQSDTSGAAQLASRPGAFSGGCGPATQRHAVAGQPQRTNCQAHLAVGMLLRHVSMRWHARMLAWLDMAWCHALYLPHALAWRKDACMQPPSHMPQVAMQRGTRSCAPETP
eukprot:351810-Chlamydomonas_euryale.AAC.5